MGKPRGRPPKDPEKLKVYLAKMAKAGKEVGIKVGGEPVESEEQKSDVEIVAEIRERFGMLNFIVNAAAEGEFPSVMVSGAGGVGKTYTINEILDKAKDKKGIKVDQVSGVVTAINLYKLLWRNKEKNAIIVLDDADAIFYSEDAVSILKAALDTSPVRKISWLSESSALKEEDIPQSFHYEGCMIFITNIDMQFVAEAKTKISPHIQALLTRTHYLDLKLHTTRQLVLWIDHIVRERNILVVQKNLTKSEQDEVLKYIKDNAEKVRNLSIRMALQLADYLNAQPSKWKNMANVLALK